MPPINDDFADAIDLTGGPGSITFSNTDSTTESGESWDADGFTVWFKWTPGAGRVQVSTQQTPLPVWDSYIQVFSGSSLASLTFVTDADDNALQPGASGRFGTSTADWVAEASTTYYIQVDAYDDVSGPVFRDDAILTYGDYIAPAPFVDDATVVRMVSGTLTGSGLTDAMVTIGGIPVPATTVDDTRLTINPPWWTPLGTQEGVVTGPGGTSTFTATVRVPQLSILGAGVIEGGEQRNISLETSTLVTFSNFAGITVNGYVIPDTDFASGNFHINFPADATTGKVRLYNIFGEYLETAANVQFADWTDWYPAVTRTQSWFLGPSRHPLGDSASSPTSFVNAAENTGDATASTANGGVVGSVATTAAGYTAEQGWLVPYLLTDLTVNPAAGGLVLQDFPHSTPATTLFGVEWDGGSTPTPAWSRVTGLRVLARFRNKNGRNFDIGYLNSGGDRVEARLGAVGVTESNSGGATRWASTSGSYFTPGATLSGLPLLAASDQLENYPAYSSTGGDNYAVDIPLSVADFTDAAVGDLAGIAKRAQSPIILAMRSHITHTPSPTTDRTVGNEASAGYYEAPFDFSPSFFNAYMMEMDYTVPSYRLNVENVGPAGPGIGIPEQVAPNLTGASDTTRANFDL